MPTRQATPQWRFWSVFAALSLLSLIASVDISIVTTALPTITRAIGGERQYVWIANSYPLASTVPQPLYAQISNLIGRRNPVLFAVSLFAVGSGIAGGATNTAMLIVGRVVQGLGTGGIYVLSAIIVSDLVPLRQRSQYVSVMFLTAAVGGAIGPLVGGAFAERDWRWIFYLNVPASGVSLVVMFIALKEKSRAVATNDASIRGVLVRVDLLGSVIFIPSVLAILLGLVLGGVDYPWSSYHIIVPLVIGFVGWGSFHVYQTFCKEPSVPNHLFKNRTTVVAFGMGFIAFMLTQVASYFLPVYFMTVAGASPVRAGVDCLLYSVMVPVSAVGAGAFVARSGRYRPLFWGGFALQAVGYGLLSTLGGIYSQARSYAYEFLVAIGTGLVIPAISSALMAPLPESDVACVNGVYSFLRSFAFVWGVTISSIVFNSQFDTHGSQIQDDTVRTKFADGAAYTSASGGFIAGLPQSTRKKVIAVYMDALGTVWQVAIALSCVGFLLGLVAKHVPLREELHTEYGLEESTNTGDCEQLERETAESK
ncbi:hypothetical protein EYZ11_010148 [Aspergillus tanneri]|uniref:Major facilitator superfamily (MFS) profile domain-containing protein n=1 Tax=Aspergillus tanneri TaxID=1220188 RepID=A0A4S3J6D4_9EURO|nr:uncharacterized protein ATNIH1004_008842 [Aspergillus tanneri]KAA8644636.1 hypothetical protein ATNIH1004_008842 [Aspergillus tanneri]THC90385.1 hypothetical protein EYZ11_010148 [Aspergillus tanneri]